MTSRGWWGGWEQQWSGNREQWQHGSSWSQGYNWYDNNRASWSRGGEWWEEPWEGKCWEHGTDWAETASRFTEFDSYEDTFPAGDCGDSQRETAQQQDVEDENSVNTYYLIGDRQLDSDQIEEHLRLFVSSLEQDMFTAPSVDQCFKIEEHEGLFKAPFYLPPTCAARKDRASFASSSRSLAQAKAQAGADAMNMLIGKDLVDDRCRSAIRCPSPESATLDAQLSEMEWPEGGIVDTNQGTELAEWGRAQSVSFFLVEGSQYAVCACRSNQWANSLNGGIFGVKAAVPMVWDTTYESPARAFHALWSSAGADYLTTVVVLAKETDGEFSLDLVAMREAAASSLTPECAPPPLALPRLCHTISRLTHWENLLTRFAPTLPAPTPLKMHTMFDGAFDDDDNGQNACEALQIVGEGVLQLVASISMYCNSALDTAPQLQQRIRHVVDDNRLAVFMLRSNLLEFAEKEVATPKMATEIAKALIGAHYAEGDFFAVIKLWSWLADADEFAAARRHLYNGRKYSGWTLTVIEYWEQQGETGKELRVRYEDNTERIYRDIGATPEECCKDSAGQGWQPLVWDDAHAVFRSQSMLGDDGQRGVIPNKVNMWLRGAVMIDLLAPKHSNERQQSPLECIELCEVCDAGDGDDSILHVLYEGYGKFRYTRSAGGGLGFEAANRRTSVGYSEQYKALISGSECMMGRSLPKIVARWLSEDRCLAGLIAEVDQAKATSRTDATDRVAMGQDCRSWVAAGGLRYICRAQPCKVGAIYVAKVENAADWLPLTYDVETKTWQTKDTQAVPLEAVTWMASCIKRLHGGAQLTHEYLLKAFFPQRPKLDISEIESVLGHSFRDRRLLAEALTHGSASPQTLTPSCERLALIGEAAVRAFACWWYSTGEAPGNSTHVTFIRCKLLGCCNRVSYARTCVDLEIGDVLQHSSDALTQSIHKFGRAVKRGTSWQQLVAWSNPPKALGDIFLACVGAVIVDSDFSKVEQILRRHVKLCADIQPELLLQCIEADPPADIDCETSQHVLHSAGAAIQSNTVPAMKMEKAYVVDGEPTWVISPRSAQLRMQCMECVGCEDFGAASEISESEGKQRQQEQQEKESGQAVYCEDCDMWLNGPIQWEDHKISKKHKKCSEESRGGWCCVSDPDFLHKAEWSW